MIKFLNINSEKPYIHFQSLYQEALDNGQKGIEAISVSSYNQIKNEVEARYVNLKYISNNDWIFFQITILQKQVSLSHIAKFPF